MRKIFLLLCLVLITLVFCGCWKKNNAQTGNVVKPSPTEEKITNINEALKKGAKYICTYKDANGVQSKISIDNDKFKTEYTDSGKTQYSIYDGSFYYYWIEGEAKGYKISKQCLDELIVGTETESPANQSESEFEKEIDNYSTEDDFNDASEVNCQAVNNVDLSLPKEVSFTDQCDTLKAAKQLMKSLEGQVNEIFDKVPQ